MNRRTLKDRPSSWIGFALVQAAILTLAGCSGSDGEPGPPGPPGPPAGVDIGNAARITATIDGVTISSPPVVAFSLTDDNGNPVKNLPASAVSFKIAKLVPGTDGNASAWQSYVNEIEEPGVGPGTESKIQATTENGSTGSLVDDNDGSYTYTFALDVTDVTQPLAVSYDPALTHRVALEIRGFAPVRNPIYDFRPSDGATTGLFSREIVSTETCNNCHANLSLHGGARFEVPECVTCHNPGSADANSGNTVDMTVMIHKIHHGENLPSVIGGADYCIYGRNDLPHCYSDVVHSQDIRLCSNCHDADDAATPEASNWYELPTMEACGDCHDDVNFSNGDNHAGIPATNAECVSCHATNPDSPLEVRQAHRIIERERTAEYRYTIESVSSPGPGGTPEATFSVTNPGDETAYDLASDEILTASGLRLSITWDTEDYSNADNGRSNSQPEATNVYSDGNLAAIDNGDFTYRLTLGEVGNSAAGSGVVIFEGAVAAAEGNLGVKNAHSYFAITDDPDEPTARRISVDMDRCNDCHDTVSVHNGRNADSIEACQTCHNANAARGGTPSRGPMDVKYFVHRIHAVDDIRYPQSASNCTGCHTADGFYPTSSDSGVLATSVNRGTDAVDPWDNDRITANTSACGVCHSASEALVHMEQNGGSFEACQDPDGTVRRRIDACSNGLGEVIQESCTVCHGPGRSADTARVHGLQE